MSKPASPDDATADAQQINAQPRWEAEWSNVKRRREEGVDQIDDWLLQKRKSRHLARERDIDPQRAANLLKYGEVEVPDEVVL